MNNPDTINNSVDTLANTGLRVSPVKGFNDWQLQDVSLFAGCEYFHPEKGIRIHGAVGDPVPYSLSRDSSIGGTLVLCFVFGVIFISASRNLLLRQLKNFFYVPRNIADMTATKMEVNVQYFLVFITSILIGIGSYIIDKNIVAANIQMPIMRIATYSFFILASFFLRHKLYDFVNWTFFDKKKNEQWKHSWAFLAVCEGILLFPIIVLYIYSNIPFRYFLIYSIFVITIAKLFTFYKCKSIFFNGIGGFLQIILYFCALEIVPLLILCGFLVETSNYLDIYF